jgi:hypothetical protein
MKRRSDNTAPALAVITLVAALAVVAVALHRANSWLEGLPSLAGGCGEDLVASAPSPDRKHVAAVFVRNCGATTSFATHVNLRASSHSFAATPHGTITEGEVFVREGEEPVKLVWKSATHLIIECPLTEVFQQEGSWRGIAISYRPPRKCR